MQLLVNRWLFLVTRLQSYKHLTCVLSVHWWRILEKDSLFRHKMSSRNSQHDQQQRLVEDTNESIKIPNEHLNYVTYNVPATRVLIWDMFSVNSLAKPKSAIFGVKFSSRSMLLVLISLCTTCGLTSSWRYESPFAIPIETPFLSVHVNLLLFCSPPASQNKQTRPQRTYKSETNANNYNYAWVLNKSGSAKTSSNNNNYARVPNKWRVV